MTVPVKVGQKVGRIPRFADADNLFRWVGVRRFGLCNSLLAHDLLLYRFLCKENGFYDCNRKARSFLDNVQRWGMV